MEVPETVLQLPPPPPATQPIHWLLAIIIVRAPAILFALAALVAALR